LSPNENGKMRGKHKMRENCGGNERKIRERNVGICKRREEKLRSVLKFKGFWWKSSVDLMIEISVEKVLA
jgi:hypothetical protein